MYTLKKYMGYSNEKIEEIFGKDDLEKCLEEAAESYRALEHPEKTMQDAMKETLHSPFGEVTLGIIS